jgi:FMN-dependent NADH-azoreductase
MHPTPILLRIDASARNHASQSRRLGDAAQALWQAQHPGGRVVLRDLAAQPIAHLSPQTVQGFDTLAEQMTPELRAATALSDTLIAELKGAHTVLITSPIYNFSVPAALKAWIDQVVRIRHTFSYDGQQFGGLAQGPRAVLALAYGVAGYDGPMQALDHLQPYLVQVLNFIGITDVRTAAAQATSADAATVSAGMQAAERALALHFSA